MLVVFVHIQVKPNTVDAFKTASVENARHSLNEPGVVRFDVLQNQRDQSKFVLVEIYKTADDAAKHKETQHYEIWRSTVADMMAEPRYSIKYDNVFPEDSQWI